MQQRITIDKDTKKIRYLLTTFWDIILYKNLKLIEIKPSTKKGFHFIIWLKKPVTDKIHFELRKKWGDDRARILLDKIRLKRHEPINILFTEKTDFYYKKKRKV